MPNPENCSLEELRCALACCPDRKAQGRINAVLLLLCGGSFELTQAHSGVSGRCLQLWIKRFNEAGIDGITCRPRPGRPRAVSADEVAREILPVVEDPGLAGRHHWTVVSLCGWLREQRDLEISCRTLLRYLHEHDYARRIPRPVPEPQDKETWQQQRKDFVPQLLELLKNPQVAVCFGDEAGFEGDPRPRQRWVKRGTRPAQGCYGGHIRRNIIGAVNPASDRFISLIVPHCDTEMFQAFLDTMAREHPAEEGRRVCLVLDNARWHRTGRLEWHHIQKVFLPPCSPDLNPVERLWQYLKSHGMAGYFTADAEALSDQLCQSIRQLLNQPQLIQSVCSLPHL